MIPLVMAAAAGAALGVFGTVLVLVAVDAHRYDRAVRRPVADAARHGVRAGMLRITGPSTPTDIAGRRRQLERGQR